MAIGEDQIQLICGGCVSGLDGVGVDSGGRGRIGVAEATDRVKGFFFE